MIRLVTDDLRPPGDPPKRHLLSVGDLTRDDVERLLGTARTFETSLERHVKKLPTLKGHLIVNLFYESSTRTSSLVRARSEAALGGHAHGQVGRARRWTRASRSRTRRSRSAPTTPT